MDKSELQELNARADTAAGAEGAGASVQVFDLLPAEVQPSGVRVVLSVFRLVNGELREDSKNYRPGRADLGLLIERDAREMAIRLLSAN